MYLISLTSNNTGFKNVYFNKRGLSIILGDQVDTTPIAEKNTFNGVGKSLLIELIHFCLGAELLGFSVFLQNRLQIKIMFCMLINVGKPNSDKER